MNDIETNRPDVRWHKSSYSNGERNCVEVAGNLLHAIGVRDSKNPESGVIAVPRTAFAALLRSVR